jgi:hypothetical protein
MELLMKFLTQTKKLLPALTSACLLSCFVQSAYASSSINSFANLTYTINNITIQGSGSLDDLQITDSLVIAPSESEAFSSLGSFSFTPIDLSTTNKQVTLLSNLQDGFANLSEGAQIGLNFNNASLDTSYLVEISLGYQLSASSNSSPGGSDFANTDVLLSYFNNDFSFSGSDLATSFANDSTQLGTVEQTGNSGIFSFTLTPGQTESLLSEVRITGNLEASPVPVPGAVWLFTSALMTLTGLKRKKTAA